MYKKKNETGHLRQAIWTFIATTKKVLEVHVHEL